MNFQTLSSVTLGSKISALTKVLLVLGAFVLPNNLCFGDAGIISSYVNLTANGSPAWYGLEDLGADTTDFDEHFLGVFDLATDTLSLTGGQVNTFKNDSGTVTDVTGADIFYRVYPTGGAVPDFSNFSMDFGSNATVTVPVIDAGGNTFPGSGDQRWEKSAALNILSGLGTGEYTIDVFSRASTNVEDEFRYQSNSSNNYKATFTAIPEPSAFLFGGLICGVLGMYQTRRQRRSRG